MADCLFLFPFLFHTFTRTHIHIPWIFLNQDKLTSEMDTMPPNFKKRWCANGIKLWSHLENPALNGAGLFDRPNWLETSHISTNLQAGRWGGFFRLIDVWSWKVTPKMHKYVWNWFALYKQVIASVQVCSVAERHKHGVLTRAGWEKGHYIEAVDSFHKRLQKNQATHAIIFQEIRDFTPLLWARWGIWLTTQEWCFGVGCWILLTWRWLTFKPRLVRSTSTVFFEVTAAVSTAILANRSKRVKAQGVWWQWSDP